MKICQRCGHENEENAKFCGICGQNLQNIEQPQKTNQDEKTYQQPADNQIRQEPDNQQIDFQPANSQQTSNQQQYNAPQNTYQPSYQTHAHKNMWIAVILDIVGGLIFYFLCGIGQLYLGLYKRGITLCLLGLIPVIINLLCLIADHELIGSLVSLLIGLILLVYSVYDAYKCTNAINEGQPIPLLFGSLDLQ